jgi:hypothetical protein
MSSLAYLFGPLFLMNYTKSIQKTYINFPFHILKISLHSSVKELTLAVHGVHGYFTLRRKAPTSTDRSLEWPQIHLEDGDEKGKKHGVLTYWGSRPGSPVLLLPHK